MNRKRVLALLLAVAMSLPSNGIAVMAAAQEADVQQTEEVEEAIPTDDEEYVEELSDEKVSENEKEAPPETPADEEEQEDAELPTEEPIAGEATPVTLNASEEQAIAVQAAEGMTVDENGVLHLTDEAISGDIVIPKDVVMIPESLFAGKNIRKVTFAKGSALKTIEKGAFSGSTITEISLPGGVTEIAADTFKNCFSLKTVAMVEVTSVGNNAFENCSALTTVQIPNIKTIGDRAFYGCSTLSNISSLGTVETIGVEAFQNCVKLYSDEKDDLFVDGMNKNPGIALISVGDRAFYGCTSIKTVGMKYTQSDITFGSGVFQNCTALTEIWLPESLNMIPDRTFMGCKTLVNVTFGKNTDSIGASAFQDCKALTSLLLPEDVKTIGASAFENCTALKKVTFNTNLKTIGDSAFKGCTGLTTLDIKKNVDTIEEDAFAACSALTKVTIRSYNSKTGLSTVKIAETAFPDKKANLTMEGYDGTVEEYAGVMRYTFNRMGTHSVNCKVADDSTRSGKIASSVKKAAEGEIVYITLTPDKDAVAKEIKVNGSSLGITLEKVNGTEITFSFEMPNKTATVTAYFGRSDKAQDNYTVSMSRKSEADWNSSKQTLTFSRIGQLAYLQVKNTKDTNVEPWMFDLTSSRSKVAVISADGTIRSVGKGSCMITLHPKNGGTDKTIRVVVDGENKNADSLSFSFPQGSLGKGQLLTDEETGLPVIRFTKSAMAVSARDFEVELQAKDEDGNSMAVEADWSVVDTAIATVNEKTTGNNKNRITINKGVNGETAVTVSVKRPYRDEDGDKLDPIKAKFIVQVINAAPRLEEQEITVNSNSQIGTPITLVPCYGYEYKEDSLVVKKIVEKKGVTYYESCGFEITDGRISGGEKAGTYENQYVIEGKLKADGSTFRVKLPKITVIGSNLNPTLKMTGKLNLFYVDPTATGSVTVTQSLKKETVEKYILKADTTKDEGSTFTQNFKVEMDADGKAVISRTDQELVKDEGKTITSGYLVIYYKGYENPLFRKITIPTTTAKPSVALEKTKLTVSTYLDAEEIYDLAVLDKTTKKALPMDEVSVNTLKSATAVQSVLKGVSVTDEGKIRVELTEAPMKSGKLVLSVKQNTWSSTMDLTLNVAVTKTLPKVTLSASALNLSKESPAGSVSVKWDQKEAQLDNSTGTDGEIELTYAGSKKYAADAAGIKVIYRDGRIMASMDSGVSTGSYKFTFTPEWKFGQYTPVVKKVTPVSVTVKVVKNSPIVTITGKGSLDLVDRTTSVVYTPSLKYTNASVKDVSIQEWKKVDGKYVLVTEAVELSEKEQAADSETAHYTEHFRIVCDKTTGKVALYARDTAKFYKTSGYKIALTYTLEKDNLLFRTTGAYSTKQASVSVKQTLPDVKSSLSSITMFAGERYNAQRIHAFTVKSSKTGRKIQNVKWAKGTADEIKEAIKVSYDAETGKVTMRLTTPSAVKLSTTYDLKLEAVYEGQWVDSVDKKTKEEIKNGKQFDISIFIRK